MFVYLFVSLCVCVLAKLALPEVTISSCHRMTKLKKKKKVFSHKIFSLIFLLFNTKTAVNLSQLTHKMKNFLCVVLVPPVLLAEFQLSSLIVEKINSLQFLVNHPTAVLNCTLLRCIALH